MKRWFVTAALLVAGFPCTALRWHYASFQSTGQWTALRRPTFLTPDHKPTAKLPSDKYA